MPFVCWLYWMKKGHRCFLQMSYLVLHSGARPSVNSIVFQPKLHNTACGYYLRRMNFKASIQIMPLEALLDPQGKAVTGSMKNLGLSEISHVRIGKNIHLQVDAKDEKEAADKVEMACKKLLCNEIMESYTFTVVPA